MNKSPSELKGKDALLFWSNMIEPAGAIMSDTAVRDAWREGKRFRAINLAIRNNVDAVVELIANWKQVPVEELEIDVFTLPRTALEMLNDDFVKQLFTLQGQTGDATSSGSASENTKDKKQ